MTVLKSKRNSCGYSARFLNQEPSVTHNIKKIRAKTSVNGAPVKTVDIKDFDKEAVAVASAYNPPKIKTLLTPVNGGHALVSNLVINGRTVQFICVDGGRLSQYEFENPDLVIQRVNSGQLPPIVFPNLDRLSSNNMTTVDAYAGSIWYCLFLWEIFGRVAIIDDSQVFLSVVNVNMANAFWNSHYMTYGNGREPGAPAMGALTSIDVVGHESGHGVIEALGNLTYQGESGALNESIADIFGTCLEKYYDIKSNKNLFDWDLGEDFMVGGMRSLSNPKSHDQPDTYRGANWADPNGQFDNGGVHINSGVNNYFFYSVVSGASGKNDNGVEYKIERTVPIFHLAKFIYLSLKGETGYRKITSDVSYHQYVDCLLANYRQYLSSNNIDASLGESILQGLVAVGLRAPSNDGGENETPVPEGGEEDNHDDTPVPDGGEDGDNHDESPPQPDNEPSPQPEQDPSPQPQPEPESRTVVWTTNFGDKNNLFYKYGITFQTNDGLYVYPDSEVVGSFNLKGLRSPAVHISGDLGNNNLQVTLVVGGRTYQHVSNDRAGTAVGIPNGDLSEVVIILRPVNKGWLPSWAKLTSLAFSSL